MSPRGNSEKELPLSRAHDCPTKGELANVGTGFALLLGLLLAVAATTKTDTTLGVTCWENTTFKFMVSTVPNDAVDFTGQRFWIAAWPGGTKCVAGINFPMTGQQLTFHLLRWSWRG